jgi:cobalamin biosynthesis Co2+ chelatase CbiK
LFLSGNDFKRKSVIPFMTNAGWPGTVINDMASEAKKTVRKLKTQRRLNSVPWLMEEPPA